MTLQITDRISLGMTDLLVSPMGVGINTWGSYRQADPSLKSTFETAVNAGFNLFDTAETYHFGGSEKTLGQFLPGLNRPVVVTTKYFPFPWRFGSTSLIHALRASLARLNLERVDLYLIHWPTPLVSVEKTMEALAAAKEAGLVQAIGVSNYDAAQVRRAHATLAKHGIPLACNQTQFSLMRRDIERNGVLSTCQELGVKLVAYRPLAGGYLTGKYSLESPPKGPRRWMYRLDGLTNIQQFIDLLKQMGEAHGGKLPSQVALNWLICKGALPIPGTTRVEHVEENAGALGWQLSPEECALLEAAEEKLHAQ